jgi:tRNA threonylcarbamoyladenosine biosynthesis protein TsaE
VKNAKPKRETEKASAVLSHSEAETFLLAEKMARPFTGQEVVLLIGELGAGKTIFAKGLASGLGVKDTGQVTSPSYTILNIYQGKYPIFHFDLYRLESDAEIEDLGWEDYLDRGVVVVEWGEKIRFALSPGQTMRVFIDKGKGDQRIIKIERNGVK